MADKPKLTRAERKQIEAVIRKYRGDGKPHTAQDTIPYQIMYPDGICYLGNRRYSQSIEFFDINYLLAQPDDQTAIFEYLCDLYNYLDSSMCSSPIPTASPIGSSLLGALKCRPAMTV